MIMINDSFPIVAQKTMDFCLLRLLAVNTYYVQQHHSKRCSQLLFRSEFQKNFDAVCFSDQNSNGRISAPFTFTPFFLVGKAYIYTKKSFRNFGWKSSVIYTISSILCNKFWWVCANIKYSWKYVFGIFSWHWKLLIQSLR